MYRKLLAASTIGMYCSAVLEQSTAGNAPVSAEVPQTNEQAALAAAAKEAQHSQIKAKFNNLVDIKESKFFFKKVDITGPDEKDPSKQVKVGEHKRPTIELPTPVLSIPGLIKILENGVDGEGNNTKELELVMEALADVVIGRARDLINDDEKITGVENFPMEELSWSKIANLPKAERRGGGISKEIWEAFAEDYIAVMPAATGKSAEQVSNAAKILLNKFNQVKTVKQVLKLMKDQLGIYVTSSPNAETYADAVKFLLEKADALINFDEASLLKNL